MCSWTPVQDLILSKLMKIFIPFTTLARKVFALLLALSLVACGTFVVPEKVPPRTMGVNLGPDSVFAQPVAEIVPELQGAEPTGINGRLGPEMVFWGFNLSDGTRAELFACAVHDDINCEARVRAICPARGEELTRTVLPGLVTHLNCRPVGLAAPGDLRPNCDEYERTDDLLVGLMQCR